MRCDRFYCMYAQYNGSERPLCVYSEYVCLCDYKYGGDSCCTFSVIDCRYCIHDFNCKDNKYNRVVIYGKKFI